MLAVNCAAIAPDLMESQLFGHRKGAFTGAEHDHQGWFRQADSGTLFLDEVGELTLEGQAKLLRILEGHSFQPVGSTEEVTVDVRVIAAANADLRAEIEAGRFREDLYYRLNVLVLRVSPLRERRDDIAHIALHLCDEIEREHGITTGGLSEASLATLEVRSRPGGTPGGGPPPNVMVLALIHISEPTRRTPISYGVVCLKKI